ncbi:MAG: DR2241 family protein, partial [Myxococcota bacterium]
LDEPPYIRDIGTLITARQVVVVPMFTADGYHTRDQIPTYLGLAPEGGADLPLSGEVQGRRIWCTHAVGLQPRMVDVILDRVKSAGWSMPDTPIHPRPMPPGGELLFEAQRDAEAWSWGQVAVVQNGQGFMLHRVGDSAPHELLGDREALRLWCRHDAHGQYRSLASAPTLRGGWCMGPLDVREAAWALETIYPGRMMAWARLLGCAKPRERVWPLRHVAMRHTGMLAGVQEQDSARLTSVMAHVCGGCLCTRLWDVDSVAEPWDELFLSVVTAPKLPCLEPCAPLLEDAAQEQ